MNEKKCFPDGSGRWIMMEIPRLMKGLVKSITRDRSAVIVNGAMAISASWVSEIKSCELGWKISSQSEVRDKEL